jgi:hypothetical protein
MLRSFTFAAVCIAVALPAAAQEVCVACSEPAASYRCTIEQPATKVSIEGPLAEKVCTKVLASKGAHSKCQIIRLAPGASCDAPARTVTLTDYQRASVPEGQSTYEPGAFEIARQNVHDTWLCVTSMFKDC